MKKIILSLGAVALISVTACKKETTKTETPATENSTAETSGKTEETASTEAPTSINGIEIPKFSNPDVQKFATEFAKFSAENMEAAKSGDAAKIQELTAKAQEWGTKQAALTAKMTPEDVKLWSDFAMKLSQAQIPK